MSRRSAHVLSRVTDRRHGRWFWIAWWVGAAAAEFGALVPVIFGRDEPVPGRDVVFRMIGGWFAACGLIAWRRRPDSRSGLLMTATGFCFFLFPLLSQIDAPAALTLGTLVDDYWTVPPVALLLTYVTGGRCGRGWTVGRVAARARARDPRADVAALPQHAAWVSPRLRGPARGALALLLGAMAVVTGVEAAHYANQVGASGDDVAGCSRCRMPVAVACVTTHTTRAFVPEDRLGVPHEDGSTAAARAAARASPTRGAGAVGAT